jgi:hypothetical protein
MTARRVSTLIGALVGATVLGIAAMVAWSVLHPSEAGRPLPLAEGPALGDLTGYVARVDGRARTLDVTDNPLGLRPTMLVLTDATTIMVNGKQGGLGDLVKDVPVRVFYEVRDEVKYVTSLQVIPDGAATARSGADTPGPVADVRPIAEPAPRPAASPPPVPVRAPVGAVVSPPAVPARTPPAPRPAVTAPAAPAPTRSDAEDGSAAVDWLFQTRRR